MQRQFTIIKGPAKGRSFELADGKTLTIGRGRASDTRINDPRMSRVHCRIAMEGNSTILFDEGSTGGTHVGNSSIGRYELKAGDVFRVGDTEICYSIIGTQSQSNSGTETIFGRPKPKPKVRPLEDLVGETFSNYRLDSIITMGNSGMVFRATDAKHDKTVAVKVLAPDLANGDEQKERFVCAMRTMLPIRHPNIVPLYNAGQQGPYCWAAMEFIDGQSMTTMIDRVGMEGILDWRCTWRVAVHIGRALAKANENGIIHRNVTPANILQRSSDKVCLLGDLVLAKALEGTLAKQLTQPGQLIGDIPYMSPERTQVNESADHRSDLYGLGATLYALLSGRPPFDGDSLPMLVQQVRDCTPKPPNNLQLSIDERFQDVVLQLLAKNPTARYQTAQDLLSDLQRIGKSHHLSAG